MLATGAADPCPICGGLGEVLVQINGNEHRVFCQCRLQEWLRIRAKRWAEISALPAGVALPTLDSFVPYSDPGRWADMEKALEFSKSIITSPLKHKWMTLIGTNGCGKSMLLKAIYQALPGYAVYLEAGRLATLIFESFDENNTDELLHELEQVSVLLIDDWGIENVRSETVTNRMFQMIDRRYQYGLARPTIVATNKTRKEMRQTNNRIADRLLDQDLVEVITLLLPSHRDRTAADEPSVVQRRG